MLAVFTIPLTDFELPAEVITLGVIAGLTYAVLGMGLTLTYKSSRVLNFAHGELGALPAIIIPVLVINYGWSYWSAMPLALVASAVGGALMELVVIRKLARSPRLIVLVATIGVSQLFFAIGALIPKEGRLGSAVFPTPFDASITIGNLRLGSGQLLILAVVPVVTVALAVFLQRSRVGMASRAAAENVDAAQLAGVPVRRISLAIWILAGVLAGISAILLGPTRPIVTRVALGPSLMVRALAAAMIGGLGSMPRVFAGGIVIGLVEALVQWNYPTGGTLEVVIFVVVLVSLLARRGLGAAARGGEATSWSLAGTVRDLEARLARKPRVRLTRAAFLVVLIALAVIVAVPMSNSQRVLMSSIALFAIMGLSLVVLTGFAGQVSLGQFAFVGLGAIVGGRMHQLGYPPWMAVLYAVLAGGLVALVIGLPAQAQRG
jgi:branched-subunit amino acid ABC-type transport system permease component